MKIDLPRGRPEGASRVAAALRDVVGASLANQLIGVPVRAVVAGRVAVAQALGFLSEAAVVEYLARRFTGSELPPQLARVIHRSTEGNPLFMVNVVDYLAAQGLLSEAQGRWQLQAALNQTSGDWYTA